jgi:hypothetical protein
MNFSLKTKFSRHGGPYDRGISDSYRRRERSPHYYVDVPFVSHMVTMDKMTQEEIAAYNQGFDDNEAMQNFKDYE